MSISPFIIKSPTSFGFDTPGLATTRSGSAVDNSAAETEERSTTPQSPAPTSAHSIDPMLLVYQERVETFRILVGFVRTAVAALLGRRPRRVAPRRAAQTLAAH